MGVGGGGGGMLQVTPSETALNETKNRVHMCCTALEGLELQELFVVINS